MPLLSGVNLANLLLQHRLSRVRSLSGREPPCVITADGQTQGSAHHPDRPEVAMLIDETRTSSGGDPKM